MNLELPGRQRPYLMAHRGNSAACPENTVPAFVRALADGADLLETDLRLTADGVFVCIHDATVDRTTDGRGAVADLSLAALQRLDASGGREGFAGVRVATLAEVLALLPDDRGLVLELKTDRFLEEPVARRLAAEVAAGGARQRTALVSFSLPRLRAVQQVAPELPIGHVTLRKLTPPRAVQLAGPWWPALFWNPLYVRQAHRRGIVVCPLDDAPFARLWYYRLLGCDVLMAGDTGRLAAALGRLSARGV